MNHLNKNWLLNPKLNGSWNRKDIGFIDYFSYTIIYDSIMI